jgi:hypothetical protein
LENEQLSVDAIGASILRQLGLGGLSREATPAVASAVITNHRTFETGLKVEKLPVYKGEKELMVVSNFITDIERHFEAHCRANGWFQEDGRTPKTQGWVEVALE